MQLINKAGIYLFKENQIIMMLGNCVLTSLSFSCRNKAAISLGFLGNLKI